MNTDQPQKPAPKDNMHSRNSHRGGYDFKLLCKAYPALRDFIGLNNFDVETIDFSDPEAVKAINKALLKHYYGVDGWDIPEGYLCPPIPGRADYVHYAADLLAEINKGKVPRGDSIQVLDIGMGANLVYPLIGNAVYKWQFTGSDIDPVALRNAKNIIGANKHLEDNISLRLQTTKDSVYTGVINPDDRFDLTMCNPPFHASFKEAKDATATKWKKLGQMKKPTLLNFGGQKNELWTNGGEAGFIRRMIEDSVKFSKQCLWFTSLVSKKDTLPTAYSSLKWVKAQEIKTINMAHGQKSTRIIAWTFLTPEEQTDWKNKFWK